MIDWIDVNTPKIKRIGYNSEIKIMYIDFSGSSIDIPFKGVSEHIFKEFRKAKSIDEYYDTRIKDCYVQVQMNTTNKINISLK